MKKLMHILFLSCLKATELIEKRFHFKLSSTERMQLMAHKMMCNACTLYEKQSLLLEKGIENHLHQQHEHADNVEQLKIKINAKLKDC